MKYKAIFLAAAFAVLGFIPPLASGQESAVLAEKKFKELPGYKGYEKIRDLGRKLSNTGRVSKMEWSKDFGQLAFTVNEERKVLNLSDMKIVDFDAKAFKKYEPEKAEARPRRRSAGRARQRTSEPSPDEKWTAKYQDHNVTLVDADKDETKITTEGTEQRRFGTGCWVYGEELNQGDAMWWSEDSKRLAYYEMNEEHMTDYFLTVGNAELYTKVQTVRYPKAGDPNPKVGIHVYNLETKKTKRLEIPGEETQYLFNIRFLPGGHELLVSRTNRHQNKLDLLAIDVDSGEMRTVVSESQETWQDNAPLMRMLEDGQRFVWESERTGYKHFELRNLDGEKLNQLSEIGEYPCRSIVKLDEESGWMYYTAFSSDNPYNAQLHRVKLDGSQHTRITTEDLNHTTFEISPDDKFVVSRREQFDIPPSTVVYSCDGKEVAVLNEGGRDAAEEAGLPKQELFSFKASDGQTEIFGTLHKPADFDPNKKYPLLVSVYGGPQSGAFRNSYSPANSVCEMGFVVAKIGNRGTNGRGKAFESANYLKLGDVDIQDQADGVKHLRERPYIDGDRVGIYGHSYGGYMSALAVLKYPDVFHVAVAGAPVTTWKNYDTIYTERYMRTPQENEKGYKDGDCLEYVDDFKGRLLLVHGLIDDNVHPSNTWQLAKALQSKDQRFDMMIYPGFKHGVGSTYNSVRWEYFVKHLRPEPSTK